MKTLLGLTLAILLAAGLFLGACASPAPLTPSPAPVLTPTPSQTLAPTPSTSPTLPPTPAKTPVSSPPKVNKIKYSDMNSENSWEAKNAIEPFLKSIENASGGRVVVERYYSETLVKAANNWQAVKSGVADLAFMGQAYMPGMMPLGDALSLPFLPYKSAEQASGIFWQLLEKYPSFKDQFKDNKVLVGVVGAPVFLITTKKEVKTLEDIKGLKIRVVGGPANDMMKAIGGVPVSMSMSETYLNLQKGVIDGMGSNWTAIILWVLNNMRWLNTTFTYRCIPHSL